MMVNYKFYVDSLTPKKGVTRARIVDFFIAQKPLITLHRKQRAKMARSKGTWQKYPANSSIEEEDVGIMMTVHSCINRNPRAASLTATLSNVQTIRNKLKGKVATQKKGGWPRRKLADFSTPEKDVDLVKDAIFFMYLRTAMILAQAANIF